MQVVHDRNARRSVSKLKIKLQSKMNAGQNPFKSKQRTNRSQIDASISSAQVIDPQLNSQSNRVHESERTGREAKLVPTTPMEGKDKQQVGMQLMTESSPKMHGHHFSQVLEDLPNRADVESQIALMRDSRAFQGRKSVIRVG